MELKKLMAEIVEVEKVVKIDVDAADWKSRPGIAMAQREAQDRLTELKRQYEQALIPTLLVFPLLGSEEARLKFVELARVEVQSGIQSIDAGSLYQRLLEEIEPAFGVSREFNVTQFVRLRDSVTSIGREIGIQSMPVLKFQESGGLPTKVETLAFIRRLVGAGPGTELNQIYLARQIRQGALASKHTATSLPVLILGLDSMEEAFSLIKGLGRLGEVVTVPDDVTSEFVLNVFKTTLDKMKRFQPKKPDEVQSNASPTPTIPT